MVLEKNSTIDQVHRITDIIEEALEGNQNCFAAFIDVAQAFDKVWHTGLINELNKMLPVQYVQILKSYLDDTLFRIKQEDEYSDLMEIGAGVPQGSVLGPVLYLLHISDNPEIKNTTVAAFADDVALLTISQDINVSTQKLQESCKKLTDWTKKWKIRLNETKSVHINFSNKKLKKQPPLITNEIQMPLLNEVKYLGLTLDKKLTWKNHIIKKKTELKLKLNKYYWLLGRNS